MNNATNKNIFPYLERLLDGEEVEWKTLGEMCDYIRGITYNKSAETTEVDGWKVLRANNITLETRKLNFNEVKHVKKTIRVRENQMLRKGDILICAGSGSKEHIGKTAYIESDIDYTFGGFMGVLRLKEEKTISSRYLFHYIGSGAFTKYLGATLKSSTINNLNNGIISPFTIPIPSLRVQARIVEILDKFTQLEAELEAELEARKKQYAYYRDQLLNFSQCPPLNVNIEWKTLGEVAEYVRQRVAVDQLCAQTYVGVDNLLPNRAGKQDSNYLPTEGNAIAYQPNDILIGNIRPYLKKIWKADNEGGASADVLVVRITNSLLTPGYLYHLLADDCFFSYDMQHAKGAKMPRGNKEKILDYVLPIPPLSEQRRIVDILDRFDTLTNSISEGLPKEIALRRKQYEYYRDALLNFPRPEATA